MGRKPHAKLLIERRRLLVADLYLKGEAQAAIAQELAVSQPTISADLKAVRREWRDCRVRDFDEAVAIELAKIDHLEREAWNAWKRSKEPLESTKVINDGSDKRAEKTVRHQQGDPRFLDQIHRCIAARRALLGLDAPTKIAPTGPDGDATYHAQMMKDLMKLAEQTRKGPVIIDARFIEQELERLTTPPQEPTESIESDVVSDAPEAQDESH